MFLAISTTLWQYLDVVSENLIWYAAFTLPLFLVFWVIWKKYWQRLRIQKTQKATAHHFWHDLRFSACSFFIFGAMDLTLLYLEGKGYTQLYFKVADYGWGWIIASAALVLFLDDTFFYWSHRAMHHPKLYRFFHKVHHESTDPSPLTSFAFHPSEAVIEQLMHFVLPFVMPLHFGVVLFWQLFSMLNNVLAHLGYELYPANWVKLPFLKYKTASTHHNMHHELFHGNYALYFTWWDKWMGTEFPDYEQRYTQVFQPAASQTPLPGFHQLTVASVSPEANEAYTVSFTHLPDAFRNYLAGQHVTLRVLINGKDHYRTFSISSVPGSGDHLSLTIKRIPGGLVTNFLADNLKPGDTLEVSLPAGQFFLKPDAQRSRHYVMIAGGSGITPIHSMIGTILQQERASRITLLYANRHHDTVIFKNVLTQWEQAYPNRFQVHHFFDNPQRRVSINRTILEAIINQHEVATLEFFLCGPEGMTTTLVNDLRYLGIGSSRIHRELFVMTHSNQPTNTQKARINIQLGKAQYSCDTAEGQTILEAALEQQIPMPFSCRSGLCGMCKMKCTDGKVTLRANQALTNEEVAAGYILACQALSQSASISISNN